MKKVCKRQVPRILITGLAVVAAWGCATTVPAPPDWISGGATPADGDLVAYGVGTAEQEALERAHQDAVAQISQILVRDLESQGIAVTNTVGDAVEARAERRIATWEPKERYRRTDGQGRVEQYLLYEYLPEERRRDITEVIDVAGIGDEGVSEPELTESATEDDGPQTPLEELRLLLTDSIPASPEERRVRLEEIRRRADAVQVTAEPRRQTVPLGAPAASSLTLTVRNGDERESPHDIPFRVQFREPLVDGRRGTSQIIVRTERDGTARIPAPRPTLSGTTHVVAEPTWLESAESAWQAVLDDSQLRDLLSSSVERVRARAAVEVTSRAASIPTAMIVLDRDIAGNPIGSTDTMRGMAQEFMETDFRIREADLPAAERRRLAEADSVSVAELYDILPFEVVSQTERVIVGDAHIVEFSEEDGFTVVVEVDAGAFDLRRDQVLARVSFQERISGSDARSAIRTAFQAAGRRLVRQIVPRLP
jgi:hypothetical protein